ncbi:MAG: TadE/TadG family type IV pilus assembly protein [Kiloniellaceae bacterium]
MLRYLAKRLPVLKDRQGTAAVEFGLVAPILFIATLGTLDFGRMLWVASTIEHAATAGTRYAGVRGAESNSPATVSDIQAFVQNRAAGVDPNDLTINVTFTPNNSSGGSVTVQVGYQFSFLMVGFLSLGPVQLQGSSTVVIS